MRYIGKKGLALIKRYEGFSAKPYVCPAGKWTIGYGHTNGVTADTKPVTEEEGEQLLREDLMRVTDDLNRIVPASLNQEQFDSLCSFAYNVGLGAYMGSTLRKVVSANPKDIDRIRTEFLKWVYAGNKRLPGLVERRKAEADLFICGTF